MAALTNIVRIHCGNLNGLAFRPADLRLRARGQVEADQVLLIRGRRPINHIVEAADGRRVNVGLHHLQDLCFLLDGVKGVEGVCLLFSLQENLALRLLRGDFVDRLQLPLTDRIVERILRVLRNCRTASFLGCSANDRDRCVNVHVFPFEAVPIHRPFEAVDLANASRRPHSN